MMSYEYEYDVISKVRFTSEKPSFSLLIPNRITDLLPINLLKLR